MFCKNRITLIGFLGKEWDEKVGLHRDALSSQ